nr:DUF2339 domain-containing protein [Rhodothermaceae bacterium]
RSRDSKKVGLLIESFDGIGIALMSLFIPYLFDTMWTGIGWAIEGAALVWLGMRQQRMLLRVSGYLLAIGASVAFLYGYADVSAWGYFPLSVALAIIGCQVCAYRDRLASWEQIFEPFTLYSGLIFWLVGGLEVLTDWLPFPKDIHALAVFSGVTAFLCSFFGNAVSWTALARASLFNVLTLGLLVVIGVIDGHPFVHWGALAWLLAFIATYASLNVLEPHHSPRWLGRAHVMYLWMIALLGCAEGVWLMEEYVLADSVWPLVGSLLVPCALVLLVSLFTRLEIWPFKHHKKAFLRSGLLTLIIFIALISIGGSFKNDGDGMYAAYLPVLNPLDILLLGFAGVSMFWYRRVREEDIVLGGVFRRSVLVWSLVGLMFIWMNATIARTVHHWADVPFDRAMWDSSIFQSALSISWTLLAVVTMGIVARRGIRTTWIVAASLLAIVVLKLFAVDLSALSVAPRIISFIGVGLLLLVIGYIAPVPPKKAEDLPIPESPA